MEVTFSQCLPYPMQFCWVFSPQTLHKCSYSHPLHVHASNHTHPFNELAVVITQLATAHPDRKERLPRWQMGAVQGEDCFLNPFMHRSTAVAHS